MKNFFLTFFFSLTRGWLSHGTGVCRVCGISILGDGLLVDTDT